MQGSSLRILLALLLGVPLASGADTIHLKHGGKLEGRIVQRTDSSVEIDIGAGSLTIPISTVDQIEEGRSPLHEFDDRAAELDPNDRDSWLELARWASHAGLGTQSRHAYERVLALDPENPEANRALRREYVGGHWVTDDEAYRARGFVLFEGQWMTPAEQQSVLRAREEERARAQARARTAEAEAREAEARAREAEARAEQSTWWTPVYWGNWGPGPSNWPNNPLDRPGWFGKKDG